MTFDSLPASSKGQVKILQPRMIETRRDPKGKHVEAMFRRHGGDTGTLNGCLMARSPAPA